MAVPDRQQGVLAEENMLPKLWAARGGLIVVMKTERGLRDPKQKKRSPVQLHGRLAAHIREITVNLAFEYGYLRGQGKPVLLVVEGEDFKNALEKHLDKHHGIAQAFFDSVVAFDRTRKSISDVIRHFCDFLAKDLAELESNSKAEQLFSSVVARRKRVRKRRRVKNG